MQLADFDYSLPEELIAQHPAMRRDSSRLMVLRRSCASICVDEFAHILDYFEPGDLLIANDTRVIPARLLGQKSTGGRVEVFLVRRQPRGEEVWSCLLRSNKSLREGTLLQLEGGIEARLLPGGEAPYRLVSFEPQGQAFEEALEGAGRMPLPPYIRREVEVSDRERYQTVFASRKGAVAAPTAGLHFTDTILEALKAKGVEIRTLTLHVGLGTFLPVRVEDVAHHRMHEEHYHIPQETVDAVVRAKSGAKRVFALGTTTTRALEHAAIDGHLRAGEGMSDLFIYPGFEFRVIDALITNFHLPKSTLLMLVSAFAGRDFALSAYRRAVQERFRFFSYGDCMLIL